MEVILSGDIIKVEDKRNITLLTVKSRKDEQIYTVTSEYDIPIKEGDRISLIGKKKNDIIKIETHPLVYIPINATTVNKFFNKYHIKRSNGNEINSSHEAREIANILSKYYMLSKYNIAKDMISRLSAELKVDKIGDKLCKSMLTEWNIKYEVRQLELFSISNEQINLMEKDGIMQTRKYKIIDRIKLDPMKVYQITQDEAIKITKMMCKKISETAKYEGSIMRWIWDKIFKDNHVSISLEDLKSEFRNIKLAGFLDRYPIKIKYDRIYIKRILKIEDQIAKNIYDRLMLNNDGLMDLKKMKFDKKVTKEQRDAAIVCVENNVSSVTGEAGTGKTMIIKEIITNLKNVNREYILLAPTGAAAVRIAKSIGSKSAAMTVDMYITKGCDKEIDTVIIDEAGMISYAKFLRLLNILNKKIKIILIGDTCQIQPIQHGNILYELITSNCIPYKVLEYNHRIEAENDMILINAKKILSGNFKKFKEGHNFFTLDGGLSTVYELLTSLKESGEYNKDDITILSPFSKDIEDINKYFWNAFEKKVNDNGRLQIRKGMRVMMTDNNYNINIMNGQEGKVVDISSDGIKVNFDGTVHKFQHNRPVDKKQPWVGNLSISYCRTIHKAQGSEYPCCILYCREWKYNTEFLNSALMYTAITRGRKEVWIVGDMKTIIKACQTEVSYKGENLSKKLMELVLQ